MDQDKKSPSLKTIQGKIWESGFKSGELKGELFSDVPPALERWRSAGYKTYIYSSGSVLAQKLLFQFSVAGNLTCFLYGHFDTSVGAKVESYSYKLIAEKIYTTPDKILFISDAPKELNAAQKAGCSVLFSQREGNVYKNDGAFEEVSSFDSI
jgi:enolase-phosphatase E1